MLSRKSRSSFTATPWPEAIRFALVQQAVVVLFSSLILDGGNLLRVCLYGIAAYWIGMGLVWFRRGPSVTKTDLVLIRWGVLPLCVASFFITGFIWRLRGHDVFF